MAAAAFISAQCETAEHIADTEPSPASLAHELEFLVGYYHGSSKSLVGSPIARVVQRDYQHALTNTLASFRRVTTNDLGADPSVWIREYGHH